MRRRAFTLVELLVVIGIIAMLTGIVLGGIFLSQEQAKETRTKRTVTVLHGALMEKWELFRTRRLPLRRGFIYNAATRSEVVLNPDANGRSQETDAQFLYRRLTTLRQLMRMEMPDRYEDLFFSPTIAEPGLRRTYQRKLNTFLGAYNAKLAAQGQPALTAAQYADLIEDQHESAECLYLTMTSGADMASAIQLKSRDIGDVDGDGMPEIVDGWGRPIHFLRWAPGFVSDLQPDNDPLESHDQFDPLRLELPPKNPPPKIAASEPNPTAWGFALVPLVFSAGSDGEYGIYEMPQEDNDPTFSAKNNNPYSHYDNGVSFVWRGEPDATNGTVHLDNIHNHFLGSR